VSTISLARCQATAPKIGAPMPMAVLVLHPTLADHLGIKAGQMVSGATVIIQKEIPKWIDSTN